MPMRSVPGLLDLGRRAVTMPKRTTLSRRSAELLRFS
jgi:hypothetical protein